MERFFNSTNVCKKLNADYIFYHSFLPCVCGTTRLQVNAIIGFAEDRIRALNEAVAQTTVPPTLTSSNSSSGFRKQANMVQFGPPEDLSLEAIDELTSQNRWSPVTLFRLKESCPNSKYAWIVPTEKLGGERISQFGAFAYLLDEYEAVYFPIVSA
jgi:hypothetical protein